jgi:hypothetical protein
MDYLLRDTVGGGFLLESAVGDQSSTCYSNSSTWSFQPIGEVSFGGPVETVIWGTFRATIALYLGLWLLS